jgi:putative redox protein
MQAGWENGFDSGMTLVATARSTAGTLRQDVLVDGRFRLTTDEPERLGGTDSAPSPHELLPAAIASCVSTTILMYARTKGWELGAVQVDVEYDPTSDPVSCELVIRTGQHLTAEQVLRLEKVANTCPVRRALAGSVAFRERIVPGAARPALRPAV